MRVLINIFVLLAIFITSAASGCHRSTQAEKNKILSKKGNPAFLKVLSNFEYVGSGPTNDIMEAAPHDMNIKVLPSNLEANLQYIFHRRLNGDGYAFEGLQEQLKANGVTVLDAKVVAYTFNGGMQFRISFSEGDIKGTIRNSLDWDIMNTSSLYKEWDCDDYILVLESTSKIAIR